MPMNLLPYLTQFAAQTRGQAALGQQNMAARQQGLNLAMQMLGMKQDQDYRNRQMQQAEDEIRRAREAERYKRMMELQEKYTVTPEERLERRGKKADIRYKEAMAKKTGQPDLLSPESARYYTPESVAEYERTGKTSSLKVIEKPTTLDVAYGKQIFAGITDAATIEDFLINNMGVEPTAAKKQAEAFAKLNELEARSKETKIGLTEAQTGYIKTQTDWYNERIDRESVLTEQDKVRLKYLPQQLASGIASTDMLTKYRGLESDLLRQTISLTISGKIADMNIKWQTLKQMMAGKPFDRQKYQQFITDQYADFIKSVAGDYMYNSPNTTAEQASKFAQDMWNTVQPELMKMMTQPTTPTGAPQPAMPITPGAPQPLPPTAQIPYGATGMPGLPPDIFVPPGQEGLVPPSFKPAPAAEAKGKPAAPTYVHPADYFKGTDRKGQFYIEMALTVLNKFATPAQALAYVKSHPDIIKKAFAANKIPLGNAIYYLTYYFEKGIYGKGKPPKPKK